MTSKDGTAYVTTQSELLSVIRHYIEKHRVTDVQMLMQYAAAKAGIRIGHIHEFMTDLLDDGFLELERSEGGGVTVRLTEKEELD